MPGVRRAVGIGHAHHDEHRAARVGRAGGPPLAGVDDVVAAVAFDARGDVGGVRGGDLRFGHRERRADLAGEQGLEPSILLRGRSEVQQHLHVAGVRGVAVEHLGCDQRAAHDLGQRRVLEVGQARAEFRVRQKQIPKAGLARGGLHALHYWRDGPAARRVLEVGEVLGFARHHHLDHEMFKAGAQCACAVGGRKEVAHGRTRRHGPSSLRPRGRAGRPWGTSNARDRQLQGFSGRRGGGRERCSFPKARFTSFSVSSRSTAPDAPAMPGAAAHSTRTAPALGRRCGTRPARCCARRG